MACPEFAHSIYLSSTPVNRTDAKRLSPLRPSSAISSHDTPNLPELDTMSATSAHSTGSQEQRSLPSLSELGILDWYKKVPQYSGPYKSNRRATNSINALRTLVNSDNFAITYGDRLDVDEYQHMRNRRSSPASSASDMMIVDRMSSPASTDSVSDSMTDTYDTESAIDGDSHRKFRSIIGNKRARKRASDDTAWLAYAVRTFRKDKSGTVLYQCQFNDCGHEQTKQAVKRHVNDVHFNIRPWPCSHCNQDFKQKTSMLIHTYSKHTGETPYACLHCPMAFSDPARRNKHTKQAHPEIPAKPRPKVAYPKQS